jgi:hypothetical protein
MVTIVLNRQLAINNGNDSNGWPTPAAPQIRESNADLETMACSSSEPERNLRGCCWPRFQIIPSLVE